ncbi:MAG: hypothetical protein RL398_726, partial [Planctomycetota bacterium]
LADYSPSVAEVFANPARLMPMWCDGVADGSTNVHNVFAQHDALNNVFYVTWNALPVYGGVGGLLDVQVALHLNSMEIHILYGTGAGAGSPVLVGWTPGLGTSAIDLGPADLSSPTPFRTSSSEAPNLTLSATNAPILGSSSLYATAGIPANRVITCLVLSLGGFDPGIAVPGAPGCTQNVDLSQASVLGLLGMPSANYWLTIPTNSALMGLTLTNQAVALVPGVNAANVIASNAIRSNLNAY